MKSLPIVGLFLALFLSVSASSSQSRRNIEPTEEELEAAKRQFKKLGARFFKMEVGKPPTYGFALPRKTKDDDLKTLPDVSFVFALSLGDTKVTDAGLKELAKLKNLTFLIVSNTKVTD